MGLAPSQHALPPLLQLPCGEAMWHIVRPTIAIALLRSAYGVIDSVWVGRLGPAELEAMGASSFAFWILLLLGEVASMGVHAVAAEREGAGHRRGVGDAVVQGLWFSGICGVLALPLLYLIPLYFSLLGIGEESATFLAGAAYLRGMVWGVVPMTASGVLASGFKGVAEMRPVLLVNAVCVAINFALDPLLMWGGWGIPALGVAGAAHATTICSLVASATSFALLRAEGVPLKLARPNPKTLALITRIGLPISMGGLLFTGIYIALGRLLTSFGGANLSALGIGHRVESLAYTVCEGFSAAAATIVGQWLGAGRAGEARAAASHIAGASALVMLPIAILFQALARPLVSLMTSDPATIAPAVSYLHIAGAVLPLMGIELVMDGALAAAGDTTPSLVWGVALNAARLPMALLLCRRFGVEGVWVALAVSTALKALAKWRAFKQSRLPQLAVKVAVPA